MNIKKPIHSLLFILTICISCISCDKNELDCFETPPSFCNARRQFISFEVEDVRYRFCQASYNETFTKKQAPFFLTNRYRELTPNGNLRVSFAVPQLFSFQIHIPSEEGNIPNNLTGSNLPLNFTNPTNDLFSSALIFTRDCDIEYASFISPVDLNTSFHQINSFSKLRSFQKGDSTITEYQLKGTFQGVLNGYPQNTERIELDNGQYDLLLWYVEAP